MVGQKCSKNMSATMCHHVPPCATMCHHVPQSMFDKKRIEILFFENAIDRECEK